MRTFWHNIRERLRQHEGYHFAFDSLLVLVGNGLLSVCFMLFHAAVSRLMGPVDHASIIALLALLNVLNVPSGVIATTIARYVAEYVHRSDAGTWLLLVRRGLRLTLPVALGVFVVWCLAAPWFRAELGAPSAGAVIMVGACAFFGLFSPILSGALQGSRRFGWGVVSGLGTAGGRLAFGALFAALGLGVTWVMGGVALSMVLGVLLAWWPLRHAHQARAAAAIGELPAARAVAGYFWNVLLAQTALFMLVNADMIFMPRFLTGAALAAYGKAALLSRIVFFLPTPLAAVMFPRAVSSKNPRLLIAPVLITFAICLGAAGVMTLCPQLVLGLLFGGGATGPLYVTLARGYVWAAIPLALINLLAPYLWARHETARTLWLLPACLVYLAALFLFHQTPQQIILCVLAGGLLAFVLLGWLTWSLLRADERAAGAED